VRIDPATGAITGTLNVGLNPRPLAITDDDQYLYVGLLGEPKIIRIALASFSTDLEILVPSDVPTRNAFAEDILPIPGAPETIAVSTFYVGLSPRTAPTLLYDRASQRPATGPRHTGSNRITRGPSNTRIFGINIVSTEHGFRSLVVATDGLREDVVKRDLVGSVSDIEYGGGFVYATNGKVLDASTMFNVGTIPASWGPQGGPSVAVRPDAPNARVHFLNDTDIRTFHYTSFGSIGMFTHTSLPGHSRLIRWGSDGLAVGGGATIVLLRGTLVGQ
jgi:DNA-binding beta-propeller fold protein YncE